MHQGTRNHREDGPFYRCDGIFWPRHFMPLLIKQAMNTLLDLRREARRSILGLLDDSDGKVRFGTVYVSLTCHGYPSEVIAGAIEELLESRHVELDGIMIRLRPSGDQRAILQ